MKAYWSDVRPNGQPVEPGTYCFVTDLEDGSHPIPTYGRSQEEVLHKLALQNANAQLAIARRSMPSATPTPSPAPAPPPRRFGPDEILRATANLSNPATAGEAVTTLFESETGISPEKLILQNFGAVAHQWELDHSEFYPHSGNRRLMAQEAARMAGGLAHITAEHLTQAFLNLRARGDLFEAQSETPQPSPPAFPDESRSSAPSERPRPRFATGTRSTTFRSQPPARTLKYSEEEILKMPISKSRRLIETNDRDYAEACEAYFGSSAQASA
jgi:hypothetical protein